MNMRPELSPVGIKGGISPRLSAVASLAAAVLVLTASGCAGIVSKTQAAGIAALTASTANLTFGTVQVGSSSQQTLTLTNSGTASLTISQISVSGTGFADSAPAMPLTLTAGQSSSLIAKFSPTSAASASGTITIVSSAPGSPLTIPLSGTGSVSTALLAVNPTSFNFGNVNVGASGASSVTLTNNGDSNLTISSVTATGAGFSASGISAGTVLTPNQSATFSIDFAPTTAGSVAGSVSVASNATNSPTTVALSGVGVTPGSASLTVWVQSSLLRVGQTDAPGTTSSIALSSARGETVDTQVVVQAPAGGLTNVNLSASALTGPGGATIPASNLTLYREYYITVTGTASYGGGSNPPLGSGTYAEPLIPFNDPETNAPLCGSAATLKACNASVSAGQNQPYWIDVSVPRGASNSPPGTYTATISITSSQGDDAIPITLTVWNFELPVQPSELSLWTLWSPAPGDTLTTLDHALMRNKVMGWDDVAANAASDMTNFGLSRSGLNDSHPTGLQCNGSYKNLPSTSQINAVAADFPPGLNLDFYVADELDACANAYSVLKTIGRAVHASNFGVETLMTTDTPDPNLFNEGDGRSVIDHWVLLDSREKWPRLPFTGGGDLWSYTSCNTGYGNTPEWMVDYPPIDERIQAGFLNWTQSATGILYYRADGWTAGNTLNSWSNVNTTACGKGLGRPGDGIIVYPPGPIDSTEPAPGIRLKAIRDGIQDYEYAHILNKLRQSTFLNSVIVPLAASWTDWSHDPSALEQARRQLGQLLNHLSPS